MLIKRRKGWELPESAAAPEPVFLNRRQLIKAMGAGTLSLATASLAPTVAAATSDGAEDPSAHLYPVERNPRYTVERAITEERLATTYNNFYEFGSHKKISEEAQALEIRPWEITIDGLVEEPFTIGIDELLAKMPLEERVYRHRCVEAWSITVPYSGFPMTALLDLARPLGDAKYLEMRTFHDPDVAPGQRQFWYPWPYVEGLTIEEAANELAFLATGYYGKPIPKQNGSPLRLAVPWKYGFKHVKSIMRFTFTEERPETFWHEVLGGEYGFWANINPEVPHPRWSQAEERVLGEDRKVATKLYNGYAEFVAHLYADLPESEALFK
ncbi:MAG: protein-methionine-sulfoxide reductase catalytic subunit MsrP [Alphaproteobacteria bacterium]